MLRAAALCVANVALRPPPRLELAPQNCLQLTLVQRRTRIEPHTIATKNSLQIYNSVYQEIWPIE